MTLTTIRGLDVRNVAGTALLAVLGGLIALDLGSSLVPAMAILAVGFGIVAWRPACGVAAVLLAVPTMFHLYPMPRGAFSLLEIAILMAAAGTGLSVVVQLARRRIGLRHVLVHPPEVIVPVAGLVVAAGVAVVTIADPSHRAESLREVRLVIVEPLIFLATALYVLRDRPARSWAATAFVAGGVVVSGIALAQTITGIGGVDAGAVTRATVTYTHPNNLAFYLERTLLMSCGLLLLRPRSLPIWVLCGVQALGVAATFSRGALIGAGGGLAVVLIVLGMRRALLLLAGGGVIAGALAVIVVPDRLVDVGGGGSEPTRFAIWRSSLRMIADHPWTGVGPDQFLYQYQRRYVEPIGWPERYTSHPHNLVLDVWLRLGVVGLAAFAALAVGLMGLLHASRHALRCDPVAVGALAALSGGIVHGLVDNGFFLPDLATMTWFFVACIATLDRSGKGSDATD